MQRSALRLELDLPLTPAQPVEESVDLPTFISPFCEADHRSSEVTHFEKHYEAQLALHHLCTSLYNGVNDCKLLFSIMPSFEIDPL
jgi:hypothetical protein